MSATAPSLFVLAGEHSGDARGAELIAALRERLPSVQIHGAGGPAMKALVPEDPQFLDWADEAVVGLWDVLKKYGYFRKQMRSLLKRAQLLKPTVIILIDYPGFNLRFAKAARKFLPGTKIVQYVSPQVWAWNRERIPKMAHYLDLMLCIFPFEPELYAQAGLRAVFVGHPMLDTLAARKTGEARDPNLVALLPGSRSKEVSRLFPTMLVAAREMEENHPGLRFEVAAANAELASDMHRMMEETGTAAEFCRISTDAHSLMQRANVGMVCSGTATMEAAYFGLSICILYKVAWLTWVVGKRLVKVPFLGMPNLLAGQEIAKEFLQDDAEPEAVADEMLRLLENDAAREEQRDALAEVIRALGEPGAGRRAAATIADLIHPPVTSK